MNRRRIAIAAAVVVLGLAVARTLQYAHRHECPFCGRRALHLDPECEQVWLVACPDCEAAYRADARPSFEDEANPYACEL